MATTLLCHVVGRYGVVRTKCLNTARKRYVLRFSPEVVWPGEASGVQRLFLPGVSAGGGESIGTKAGSKPTSNDNHGDGWHNEILKDNKAPKDTLSTLLTPQLNLGQRLTGGRNVFRHRVTSSNP